MEQLTGLKLETDSLEIPRLPDVDRERASWMCDRELMSRPQLHTEFASDLLSVHHIVSVRTTKKRRKRFESWHFESSYKSGGKQWKDYVFFLLSSYLDLHFTCTHNHTFVLLGLDHHIFSLERDFNLRELLKIILDYRIRHLYDEIIKITPARTYAFFDEVAKRYPPVLVDLAGHIRTSQRGVKKFIDIVAELLGQPSKTISTVDVADHRFLP
ncbi:hypothetical protein F2Q70_00016216 [Brassica cretica]|uniref:Uncharacterized protein n=1 Tax=Brassica cretica TaxID=69181 RepID=A0A8S9I0J9_BRACR|nr:hypothetical protein F2Q70_00016216 [Brassica cretica]KAF2596189.1 hypothetical protein F2Q68_00009198 [Brassica cretica]